jgi:trehalose 6-phosphate synthase
VDTEREERRSRPLTVVANRLPVEYSVGEGWRAAPGGLVTALHSLLEDRAATWIGWSGRYADDGGPDPGPIPPDLVPCALDEVRLTQADVEDYYEGFSNGALWPLYHDALVAPVYHRHQFDRYRRVNEEFARHVADRAAPDGLVWVHDYQLQLVPQMLRALRPDLRIGFFLHIPFPPEELFAQLPWRRQILEGLLGADLVGFQTKSGATNFLSLVQKYLALRTGGDRVDVHELDGARTVRVDAFPIGIDAGAMESLAADPDVQRRAKEIRQELGDPSLLMLGVDRLDYTKGIDVRLRAVTELLSDGVLDPDRTTLVQVATPSRENVEEYQRIRSEVELLVGRANGELARVGSPPIHYLHQSMDRRELVALYLAADLMLVTPLRDGMNLVCKEYVASRLADDGALLLSEFAGAADQLVDAWQVNPYDIDGVKQAIVQAASSSPEETQRRMASMRVNVTEHDVQRWAADFLSVLREASG